MKPTVGVGIICRDSQDTIKDCITSFASHVDFLSITDTGSKDDTVKLIHKACKKLRLPYKLTQFEWIQDFAAARNFNFSHIPTDIDFYLWVDSDDIVLHAEKIPEIIQKIEPDVGAIWLPYHYGSDEYGNITCVYDRERILRANLGWVWRGRVHETVSALTECKHIKFEDVIMLHQHKGEKSRAERNFSLLALIAEEDPGDSRVQLYLGHQHFAGQNWQQAAYHYEQFIMRPAQPIEHYQALCYWSNALRNLKDGQSVEVALKAVELFPKYREGYMELAHGYAMMRDPDKAIYWAGLSEQYEKMPTPSLIFVNPLEHTFNRHVLLAECYMMKNEFEAARIQMEAAYSIRPIKEIRQQMDSLHEAIVRGKVIDGIRALSINLLSHQEAYKLRQLLDVCPWWFQDSDEFKQLAAGIKVYTSNIDPEAAKQYYEKTSFEPPMIEEWPIWFLAAGEPTIKAMNGVNTILDVGCGSGRVTKRLHDAGYEVYGIDPSEKSIEYAKEILPGHFQRSTLEGYVEFVSKALYSKYDLVLAGEVIEHTNNPEEFLENCDKLGDRVLLTTMLPKIGVPPETLKPIEHLRVFTPADLEQLVMSKEGRHIVNLRHIEDGVAPGFSDTTLLEYDFKVPTNLAVRLFVGPSFEYWNPQTILSHGAGGSETSAAAIAREMASLDCQPIVYAEDSQVWNGVLYRDFRNFNPGTPPCHLFISSRIPDIFTNPIPAKVKILWFHDVDRGMAFSPDIASRIDGLICLSKWHLQHLRRVYPWLKDCEVIDLDNNEQIVVDSDYPTYVCYEEGNPNKLPKIFIIGDGIDLARFDGVGEVERQPHRFIWSSSFDRGLEQLLANIWPLLKKELPDATLDIFYGWDYFNSTLHISQQRELKQRIMRLLGTSQGVNYKGRIGQVQLAKEFCSADAIIYPPGHGFRETYGITFLEAQAAGMVNFYRATGALPETIGSRGIPLDPNQSPEETVQSITSVLTNPSICDIIRREGKDYARTHSWKAQTQKIMEAYRILAMAGTTSEEG